MPFSSGIPIFSQIRLLVFRSAQSVDSQHPTPYPHFESELRWQQILHDQIVPPPYYACAAHLLSYLIGRVTKKIFRRHDVTSAVM